MDSLNCQIGTEASLQTVTDDQGQEAPKLSDDKKRYDVIPREIISAVFFSVFTLGIYAIYWTACLHREVSIMAKVDRPMPGWLVILLSIVTFGAFYLFWIWGMGGRGALRSKTAPIALGGASGSS